MLNLKIIAIGKLKEKHFALAAEEYLKRLQPFARLTVKELKGESFGNSQKAVAKKREGERILAHLNNDDYVIALDERGREFDSREFAEHLEKINRTIVLLIGGSLGLEKAVLARADEKISLSRLTLPHELARVVLLEQLYRATTILSSKNYHH